MNRRYAGKKANAWGKAFEELFDFQCQRLGFKVVDIPDGCIMRYINGVAKPLKVKSPFDKIITLGNCIAHIDTKTVEKDRFSYSDITQHQVESLLKLESASVTGYIVYYRLIDCVVFYTAKILNEVKPRSSLKVVDGILLGGRASFDVRKIFNE